VDALRGTGSARAAADQFVDRHAGRLDAAARRYDGAMDRIAEDDVFLTYLASQSAAAG
jgi:hypothetical protein